LVLNPRNGEYERRPTGADLEMKPRARGPSAPGVVERRFIQKKGKAITVRHDVTAGVTDTVTESVTVTPVVTVDRGVTASVTASVTEVVTDSVTRVAPVCRKVAEKAGDICHADRPTASSRGLQAMSHGNRVPVPGAAGSHLPGTVNASAPKLSRTWMLRTLLQSLLR